MQNKNCCFISAEVGTDSFQLPVGKIHVILLFIKRIFSQKTANAALKGEKVGND